MIRRLLLSLILPVAAFGQGVIVGPKTVTGTINGQPQFISGATVTVCAANAPGIPCSPALAGVLFKDVGLTQPLSNPTTADANGNYFFYIAAGSYTVTETNAGFSGYSYQIQAGVSGSGTSGLQSATIAGLPSASANPNAMYRVTNGNSSSDCTVGGGTNKVICFSNGTTWIPASGLNNPPSTCSSGSSAQGINVNGNATGCAPNLSPSTTNNFTVPQNFNSNVKFCGPNPYADAGCNGVRAVNSSAVPAIPGITGTITSGTPTINISSASTFQNNDGFIVYGAGATNPISTPAAPTVTPSNAAGETNTLLDVNSPTGSTTWQYCVAAWGGPVGQAETACSPNTVISTGQASLGVQTVSISSVTLVNGIWTITTSSAHTMAANATTELVGVNFNGVAFSGILASVATVPDNTHITLNTLFDTRNGAPTSASTPGSLTYWNSNRIQITAPSGSSNGTKYVVYRCPTSGTCSTASMVLIGIMWPQNSNLVGDKTYLAFDDYGPTYTIAPTLPPYISTTAPSIATNDSLVTTIVSGAGTTTLTLAANASNSVSGATVLFDDCVTIVAAATAAKAAGSRLVLPIPTTAGNSYVINSPGTLPSLSEMDYSGGLLLNDTLNISQATIWGQYVPNGSTLTFSFHPSPVINVNTAWPGLYATNNVYLHYLTIQSLREASNLFMQDGGSGQIPASIFDRIQWGISVSVNGYTSTAQVFRTNHTASFADIFYLENTFIATQLGLGTMATPAVYWSGPGNPKMTTVFLSGKGFLHRPTVSGSFPVIDWIYSQGNYMPYNAFINVDGGTSGVTARIHTPIFDTTFTPVACALGGISLALHLDSATPAASMVCPTPGTAMVVGTGTTLDNAGFNIGASATQPAPRAVLDETFNGPGIVSANAIVPQVQDNTYRVFGPAFGIYVADLPGAAPTCAVITAGPPFTAAATYNFKYAYKYPNGAMGSPSFASTGCTANGTTQQVTITLPQSPFAAGAVGAFIMLSTTGANGGYFFIGNQDPTTQGAPWNVATSTYTYTGFASTPSPTLGATGPSGMGPNQIWGTNVRVGATTLTAPFNTVARNQTTPDANGMIAVNGYFNTNYDNFKRANGAIGSTWTAINGGFTITSNQVSGTGGQNDAFYNANSFNGDQFSQFTILTVGSGNEGPTVRMSSTGGGQGYRCTENTTAIFIQKMTAGAYSALVTTSVTGAANDVLRFEVIGNTLTCFQNGVNVLSTTDSSYANGSPGIDAVGTTGVIDNWSGGNIHPNAQYDQEADWTKPQHLIGGLTIGSAVSGNILPILSGTSGSIGGGALLAGACTSGTLSITGATTSMVALTDPNTYPGDGTYWDAQVTSAGTVTVKVCAAVALTPTASTYNVRIIQ